MPSSPSIISTPRARDESEQHGSDGGDPDVEDEDEDLVQHGADGISDGWPSRADRVSDGKPACIIVRPSNVLSEDGNVVKFLTVDVVGGAICCFESDHVVKAVLQTLKDRGFRTCMYGVKQREGRARVSPARMRHPHHDGLCCP